MIVLLEILLFVTVLGTLGISIWYVPYRLCHLLNIKRKWPLFLLIGITVSVSFIGTLAFTKSLNPVIGFLSIICGWIFFVHLFLTLSLLIFDVLRRFIRIPNRLTVVAAFTVAVLLTAIGAYQANPFQVTETEIPIKGLEHDVTIMHISDVHIGHHRGGDYLEQIVKETNKYKPDIVLLNGDLVDADIALEDGELSALAKFQAPVFFTTGNHESYVDTMKALDIIKGYGVRILHNEMVETKGLQLIGLDYMNADENTFDMHAVNKLTIKEELPKIPVEYSKPIILIHHSPVGLGYVAANGVDLMVSGHTHAGQVFPGTVFAPIFWPITKGLEKRFDTYYFVSQGAGTFGMRMRLGSSNEINLITLRAL